MVVRTKKLKKGKDKRDIVQESNNESLINSLIIAPSNHHNMALQKDIKKPKQYSTPSGRARNTRHNPSSKASKRRSYSLTPHSPRDNRVEETKPTDLDILKDLYSNVKKIKNSSKLRKGKLIEDIDRYDQMIETALEMNKKELLEDVEKYNKEIENHNQQFEDSSSELLIVKRCDIGESNMVNVGYNQERPQRGIASHSLDTHNRRFRVDETPYPLNKKLPEAKGFGGYMDRYHQKRRPSDRKIDFVQLGKSIVKET